MDFQSCALAVRPTVSASPWVVSESGRKQITVAVPTWCPWQIPGGSQGRPVDKSRYRALSSAANCTPRSRRTPSPPRTTMASTWSGMPVGYQTKSRAVVTQKATKRVSVTAVITSQRRLPNRFSAFPRTTMDSLSQAGASGGVLGRPTDGCQSTSTVDVAESREMTPRVSSRSRAVCAIQGRS